MPNVRQSVIITAPAEVVYEAIAIDRGLAAWWTPQAVERSGVAPIIRFDFGPDYFKEMEITERRPNSLVRWTCVTGVEEWVGTQITFDIEEGSKELLLRSHPEMEDQLQQAQGETFTLLTFSQDDWREYTPMFAECSYTWGRFLGSLKSLCERGQGWPWPGQHRAER